MPGPTTIQSNVPRTGESPLSSPDTRDSAKPCAPGGLGTAVDPGWEELVQATSHVYQTLPAQARPGCVVLASNYGQAGALEYWSKEHDLPPIHAVHNSYWFWGPPPSTPATTFIVVGAATKRLESIFRSVELTGVVENRWAEESRMQIAVCSGPKRPVMEIWNEFKVFQ